MNSLYILTMLCANVVVLGNAIGTYLGIWIAEWVR